MTEEKVRTICRICFAECSITLRVQDGKIIALENDNMVCPMGRALPEIVHAPDRLLYPMKREKTAWKIISWDDALRFIVDRVRDITHRYGARAISVHLGQSQVSHTYLGHFVEKFCALIGTPNLSSVGSQCHAAREIGNCLTYGRFPSPDYERTKCIIAWGYNPSTTNAHAMKAITNAVNRGARLIVIDPQKTLLATLADLHLQPRLGSDRALALGMLNVAMNEQLFDADFVKRWTAGFERLKESLQHFRPEMVEGITGVSASLIRATARLYYSTKPACIAQGNAIEHHSDGVQIVRAIAILQALSGNLDVPGGASFNGGNPFGSIGNGVPKPGEKPIGAEKYPLFYEFTGEANANLLADAILEDTPYPIRGMIVMGANPALTFPNSRRVREALGRLEFLAVMDISHTDTANYAHIVLPAATFLEKTELCDLRNGSPLTHLSLAPPAIPAQGEAWPEWRFWSELAKRMGYRDQFPWEDIEKAISEHSEHLGIPFGELKNSPGGVVCGSELFRRHESEGFATPSGKVEIYSEKLRALGYDPMPTGCPNEYGTSIILSTGAKPREYIHSQFRNIPSLRWRYPRAEAHVSPITAQELHFHDNDIVTIKTHSGEIDIPVSVDCGVVPGALFIPHGWSEPNANILTDSRDLDPISGFPRFRAIPASVAAISKRSYSGFRSYSPLSNDI